MGLGKGQSWLWGREGEEKDLLVGGKKGRGGGSLELWLADWSRGDLWQWSCCYAHY
jgi:hypothetical protein